MSYSESSDDESSDLDGEAEGAEPSRAREMLANFYGKMGANQEEDDDDPTTPGYAKLEAIDRSDFDADAHVRDMLEKQKLPELLEQDDSLCRDIKGLSGDMQTLVYENYSKFIAATDTIRDMKRNVGAMEDEMKSLNTTMAEIDGMSGAVNASLADKRSKIDKLVRARRLLKRLEFLFELPRRLSAAAQAKQYKEAVRYYAMTEEILKRYDRVPSLREIHRECRRIAVRLKAQLRASLEEESTASNENSTADVAVRVELLVQLGAEALDCEKAAFASAFASLGGRVQRALDNLPEDATPPKVAAGIASSIAPAFVIAADALHQVSTIVNDAQEKKKMKKQDGDDDDDQEGGDSSPMDDSMHDSKKKSLGRIDDETDRPSFDEFALGLFTEYVDAVEKTLDAAVTKERQALMVNTKLCATYYLDAARAIEVAGDCVETAAAKCNVGDLLRMKLQRVGRRAASRRLEDSMKCAKAAALRAIVDLAKEAKDLADNDDDQGGELQKKSLRTASLAAARAVATAARAGLDRAAPLLEHLDDVDVEDCASDFLAFVRGALSAAGDVVVVDGPTHGDDDDPQDDNNDDDRQKGNDASAIMDPPKAISVLVDLACSGWAKGDLAPPTLDRDPTDIKRVLAVGALANALPSAWGDAALQQEEEDAVEEAEELSSAPSKKKKKKKKKQKDPAGSDAEEEEEGEDEEEEDEEDEEEEPSSPKSEEEEEEDVPQSAANRRQSTGGNSSVVSPRLDLSDLLEPDALRRTAAALFSRYARLVSARALRGNVPGFFVFDPKKATSPTEAVVEAFRALEAATADFGQAVGDPTRPMDVDRLVASVGGSAGSPAHSAVVAKPAATSRSVGGIELDVERLFAQSQPSRDAFDDQADLNSWNADTLAVTVYQHLARALVEHVRRVTIARSAHYAQLDLDARFLLAAFSQRLDPDALKNLETLISAFLQSASDRCLED